MPSPASVVVRSAAVLGLAWLGDALIYVVMPLHAAASTLVYGLASGAVVIVVTRPALASVGPVALASLLALVMYGKEGLTPVHDPGTH